MDEVDAAQHNIDMFLTASLLKHQHSLKQMGDVEAETCNGCDFKTKSNFGKKCEAWVECSNDIEKAFQAKRRNGK